jgi:hypothetical protein
LFVGWLVAEHEDVYSVATAEVNGTARITANPPNGTPTTATERSVTSGDSPTVRPMWGLTT